jgi:hypothetical protein
MRSLLICTPLPILFGRSIEKNGMDRACSTYRGRGAITVLEGKPEGNKPLGRPRSRWEVNIKTDLQEVGWG